MSVNTGIGVQGITEDDISAYLANTPGFFERHAELLATIQLASPHGGRAISLQERQMEMLRERIKGLERRIIEMIRAGHDNESLIGKMHRWTRAVMLARNSPMLGQVLVEELKHEFMIPLAVVRVWGASSAHAGLPWTQPVDDDLKTFAASLAAPYCGLNSGFAAAQWLATDGTPAQSVALVPLRLGPATGECFGLLVLGSPDALRFQSDMGTEFLQQVGDLASAAMARLLAD